MRNQYKLNKDWKSYLYATIKKVTDNSSRIHVVNKDSLV